MRGNLGGLLMNLTFAKGVVAMGIARKGVDSGAFPPGKSPDEIAVIVAELGEELGVWTSEIAGVVPELVPPDADAPRRPSRRRSTPPPAPRRTVPPPIAARRTPPTPPSSEYQHDVDFTSLHGAKAPTAEEDTVDLVVAELIGGAREESVLEVAPEEIVELRDSDLDDDDNDDALDPLEVSFIEFLDQAADDGDLDDMETIEPVSLEGPRPTAAYPPVPRRARPVSRITWTLRDETTATDMFVA